MDNPQKTVEWRAVVKFEIGNDGTWKEYYCDCPDRPDGPVEERMGSVADIQSIFTAYREQITQKVAQDPTKSPSDDFAEHILRREIFKSSKVRFKVNWIVN